MLSENTNTFTKENLNQYLNALGKEYRKLKGKGIPAEIILVGGAAIIANYGFRDMTTDIDAFIQAASSMKDAINHVGDQYGLPNGWMNADFCYTASYTDKLSECSEHYRTFANVLDVRTVGAEYLIAMKLRSGRQYKNDMSDIVGILSEHEMHEMPITLERIRSAVIRMYGSWDVLPEISKTFIEDVMASKNYAAIYAQTVANEKESKETLIRIEEDYPGEITEDNVNDILKELRKRQQEKSESTD